MYDDYWARDGSKDHCGSDIIRKIVLMGNPNVGKSVVFSRLTGANVIASNYPGTTVDISRGKMLFDNERFEIIDAPGTYSLTHTNKAEEVASKIVEKADIVINVLNATNLERNLFLTLELIEKNIPMIIALNLWDETKHLGINIDVEQLEKLLDIPITPITALTGEGIKSLVSKINLAKSKKKITKLNDDDKWSKIGKIIRKVEKIEHKHHTFREKISDLTIKPLTGIPIAFFVVFSAFWFVRVIGEALITYIFNPLFENYYLPFLVRLSDILGPGFIHTILIGEYGLKINFIESLGILTTGIYVPIAAVLPYIISFYFTLSLLEDSGYLPRLATLVDKVFHKLGMHGHGIVPMFLGLGCNVPGALATRTLETKKQRFISATLLAICIPCIAQMAMIFGVLGRYGLYYIGILFITIFILYILIGLLLNRFIKGESPEIFLEIPSYRRPSFQATLKKTWMRVRWFLKEAIPFLIIGIFFINILYAIGILQWFSHLLSPFMTSLFGLPGETSISLITGFLRKDLAVGMLLSFNLNPMQLVIAVTMLTIYFPCVATFSVLIKELGFKDMIKSTIIMISIAIIVGVFLRLILLRGV